jgi:hypothetical protein
MGISTPTLSQAGSISNTAKTPTNRKLSFSGGVNKTSKDSFTPLKFSGNQQSSPNSFGKNLKTHGIGLLVNLVSLKLSLIALGLAGAAMASIIGIPVGLLLGLVGIPAFFLTGYKTISHAFGLIGTMLKRN